MSLKRKLFVTFAGLGLMTLLVAGVTIWSMVQWSRTEQDLREHYMRSLLLQEVRASTFQASLEVGEAINTVDPDARQEFDDAILPAQGYLDQWADLADNEAERAEIREVRQAYEQVIDVSYEAFDLVEAGDNEAAQELFDTQIEDLDFPAFQAVAQNAENNDRVRRDEIREETESTRRAAQIMLAISSFGALSLVMLLAAYLASDLFSPLKDIRNAMHGVRQGDRKVRLSEERTDEIGEINSGFNAMVAAIAAREHSGGMENRRLMEGQNGAENGAASGREADKDGEGSSWVETPTRVTLHRMISRMRSDVAKLEDANGDSPRRRRELTADLRNLAQAVSRLTEFSYPLDLNLASTNVRETVYGVVQRFNGELIERSVSLEVDISPEVHRAVVDRLKLREALSELVRNALEALPERGGRIGLRSRLSDNDGVEVLLIEVADDGSGAKQSLIDQAFERDLTEEYSGISLVRAIIEQHGGDFSVESEPGEGTYARIEIPTRD
ncbi:ATP-binding protein [Rubrobacter indicoceani]|uniref:ATP-binding protein n=1 Tax=Rubrobacter indicoceani TaxID=2051957 RepID=UPI000E5C1CB7|nr:ATP-binding protein [Rubrobacter indicoceani]